MSQAECSPKTAQRDKRIFQVSSPGAASKTDGWKMAANEGEREAEARSRYFKTWAESLIISALEASQGVLLRHCEIMYFKSKIKSKSGTGGP